MTNKERYEVLQNENTELQNKIEKLESFMYTHGFANLSENARMLLIRQHYVMLSYSNILEDRMTLFLSEYLLEED